MSSFCVILVLGLDHGFFIRSAVIFLSESVFEGGVKLSRRTSEKSDAPLWYQASNVGVLLVIAAVCIGRAAVDHLIG